MQNLYKVKCTPNEHGIKIKIICTSPHKLQITIDSPKQDAIRYDSYSRGFVSKKKYSHRNWERNKIISS